MVDLGSGIVKVWELYAFAAIRQSRTICRRKISPQLRLIFKCHFFWHFRLYLFSLQLLILCQYLAISRPVTINSGLIRPFTLPISTFGISWAVRIGINICVCFIITVSPITVTPIVTGNHMRFEPFNFRFGLIGVELIKLYLTVHQAIVIKAI
jgi:hypothetical protein